jgi:HEAT repeat protein
MIEDALIKALDDKRETSPWSLSDSPLRENAIASLAKVRPSPAAIFKLREASEDENEYIRAWALVGLSRMREA